jgi:hypothetical protein
MGRDATPIAAGRHVTFGPGPEILESMDATGARQAPVEQRDRYVDWLRALSLVVVVIWHWSRCASPTTVWWLSRPLAIIGPLLCTLPVIYLFRRRRNH